MRKKMVKNGIFLFIAVLLVACGNIEEERSQAMFDEVQTLFDKHELNAAKLMIDSLHTTFPKMVKMRRKADTIAWKIELVEIERSRPFLDNVLTEKNTEFEILKKEFRFEKNSEYQDVGNFVPKRLKTENNVGRNYVKPYVDENGKFYLMSYFQGNKLKHRKLRANVGDIFAETNSAELSDLHAFNDGGTYRENVMFTDETLGEFPQFIAKNSAEKIRVTLIGDREYAYFLSTTDKTAFLDAFRLSLLLKDIKKMHIQQKKMDYRKTLLNKKLENNN